MCIVENDEFRIRKEGIGVELVRTSDARLTGWTRGRFPGLFVLHEAFGVNDYLRRVALRLCFVYPRIRGLPRTRIATLRMAAVSAGQRALFTKWEVSR